MVDRVIQVEIARKLDEPGLWVAFYPCRGQIRRTLFASLDSVKDAVRLDVQTSHKNQVLEYSFAEVAFESLPFEENRPHHG
jgi:hypothetical protein